MRMRIGRRTPCPVLLSTGVSRLFITSIFSFKVRFHRCLLYRLLTYFIHLAHAGLQGSTKPTHYYVVHDDYGFTQDALQGLTNDVSYLFARATKAVSLVSPAYYADLACERGRCYLHPLLQGISSSGGSVTSGGEEQYEAVMKEGEGLWGGGVSEKLKDTMFYL